MDESPLRAAVAAGTLGSEEQHRALLQSIVDVARAIFRAKASSIFLLDEEAEELVFEAVSGEGEGELVGMRLPSSTGIAGWVLVTRQPIAIDDLANDPRFARDAAERDGVRPELDDGRAAPPRGGGARRPLRARPTRGDALRHRRDGSARAVRRPGGDRSPAAAEGAPRAPRARGRGLDGCVGGAGGGDPRRRARTTPAGGCSPPWRTSSRTTEPGPGPRLR